MGVDIAEDRMGVDRAEDRMGVDRTQTGSVLTEQRQDGC